MDSMKLILTQDKFAILGKDDFSNVAIYNWHASRTGKFFFAKKRHIRPDGAIRTISLQEFLIGKASKNYQIHFKNGNTLDCRRENLEFIAMSTRAQVFNRQNKKNKKNNFIGVVYANQRGKKYVARITYKGKLKYLGYFETDIEAAKAYDEAAKKIFGIQAKLNFSGENLIKTEVENNG